MKIIFVLVFSIWLINTIQAIIVLYQNVHIHGNTTVTELTNESRFKSYDYRFNRDVTKDNDFIIIYNLYTGTNSLRRVAKFCEADVSTLDGTVAAIIAQAVGLNVVDGTPCPVAAGTYTSQWSAFSMDQINWDLINSDESWAELTIVNGYDWIMTLRLFIDEVAAQYMISSNSTGPAAQNSNFSKRNESSSSQIVEEFIRCVLDRPSKDI